MQDSLPKVKISPLYTTREAIRALSPFERALAEVMIQSGDLVIKEDEPNGN